MGRSGEVDAGGAKTAAPKSQGGAGDAGPIFIPHCPAPSGEELRTWIEEDWLNNAVQDAAANRLGRLRASVTKVCVTLGVSALLAATVGLWWAVGAWPPLTLAVSPALHPRLDTRPPQPLSTAWARASSRCSW